MAVTTAPTLKRVAAIERLRVRASEATERLSVPTVRAVVDGLRFAFPLAQIAQQTGLSEADVLDIAGSLGTWLTHVHGGSEATYLFAADLEQQQLFRAADEGIIIPLGFERRGDQRRDVARSVACIVRREPDDTELSRWIDRKYPAAVGVLSGRDVYTVWRVAQLGRLAELDLVSKSPSYAQVVVSAFDLLDVTLSDAVTGIDSLVATAGTSLTDVLDLAALEDAVQKVSWLNEGQFHRIAKLLAQAASSGSASSMKALARELRVFARIVSGSTAWPPTSIAGLTEGQVNRLVERAGLGIAADARKVESDIRARLIEMGFRNDVDRLLPEAMRAVSADLEDQFWLAIEARQAGDSDWRLQLDEALLEHASAS